MLGLLIPTPARAFSNFFSTMIGGGFTFADKKGRDLETLHNYGMLRLAFDLDLDVPFFWAVDIESFRIQRRQDVLQDHHHGEGGGLTLGARHRPYAFWIQYGLGRLRNLKKPVENFEDKAQRFRYHSAAFGVSYAIYEREYSAIDVQAMSKLVITERGWKQAYGLKNLRLASLVISFTLLDL
ncbi:hypothetical protein [Pseudobacteriovorax antillogorgiicola]|uniref:hypothetical protein n=1 Tax=Pseudobacteriovorax antillogorgiicola TaxID=1513793 RepID=UPI0010455D0D|nr:hypothetical protein [Pseudobacteriovorax antillogorgiicola]